MYSLFRNLMQQKHNTHTHTCTHMFGGSGFTFTSDIQLQTER